MQNLNNVYICWPRFMSRIDAQNWLDITFKTTQKPLDWHRLAGQAYSILSKTPTNTSFKFLTPATKTLLYQYKQLQLDK